MKQIILSLFLVIQFVFASEYSINVIKQSSSFLHLKINFDEPEWVKEQNAIYANYKNAVFTFDQNQNYIPSIVKFFNISQAGAPSVKILSIKKETRQVVDYLFTKSDKIKGTGPESWVRIRYLGRMGELPIHALTLFPVRVSGDHKTVEYLRSLEIVIGNEVSASTLAKTPLSKLSRSGAKYLKTLLINKNLQLYPVKQAQTSAVRTANEQQYSAWQKVLNNEIVFKIKVKEEGIYRVTYDDLSEAGFPFNSIDPTQLHLYNRGKEVPLYFKGEKDRSFDPEDYFEFWGEKNEKTWRARFPELYSDPFTDTNVYWLVYESKNGLRLLEESSGISSSSNQLVISPLAFRDTLHFERNATYHKFGHSYSLINRPSYEIDQYYFDGGVSAPGGIGYDFELPDPAEYGSDVTIWALFRGKSFFDSETNPLKGHKVAVKLRGAGNVAHMVGQVNPADGWKDQEMWMVTNADSAVKIDQSALNDGINRLEVDMFQTGVTDIVVLNWFEVSYLRQYKAHKNFLKFRVDKDFFDGYYVKLGDRIQFNIDGFTRKDIDVYKLGISKITNVDIKPISDETKNEFSYGLSFQDEIVDPHIRYVALTQDQKKKVLSIEKYRPWKADNPQISLLDPNNTADFLIITHDLFSKECQKFKDLKEAAGFHVEIVTVRDIYDLFNYGIKSPLAIKDFIRYAYEKWDRNFPLKYVVLVGDASKDYRSAADLVPTIFYQTLKFGAAEADYMYSLLEGDDYIPEVIVSRIPVSSVYELKNYLDKVEHYPDDKYGEWTNRTLFISGYDGTKEYLTNKPVFRTQNLRLINHRLPEPLFAEQINTIENTAVQPDPHFGNYRDLINQFDKGLSYINFLGHGGGAIWADAGLMGLEEVDQLNNGYKLPFISSMTCFTASFANHGRYSLGEKLLLSEKKGAIAFLGSSGVGWIYNDFAIEWGLFDYLWNNQLSIGEAVYLMKIFYLSNPFYYTEAGRFYTFGYGTISRSQVSQYNLFGDPSLKIVQPGGKLALSADRSVVLPSDSVTVTVKNIPEPGKVFLQVTNEENYVVFDTVAENTAKQAEISFRIPDDVRDQLLRVKVFASNQSESANGFLKIAVERPLVKRIETIPVQPQVFDPLIFKVIVDTREEIDQITIQNIFDENSYQRYNTIIALEKVNDSLYQSAEPFTGFGSGGKKIFDLKIITKSGKQIIEHWNKLYVNDPRPDLLVVPGSVSWAGESRLRLKFKLKNNSDHSIDNVKVACYDYTISDSQPFIVQGVSLPEQKEKEMFIDLPDSLQYQPYHQIRVVVDPDSVFEERDEQNNILQTTLFLNYLYATPETGTSLDGKNHQKISLNPRWQLEIMPGGVPKTTLFSFSQRNIRLFIEKAHQYDLKYIPFKNKQDTMGLDLKFLNPQVEGKVSGVLSTQIDSVELQGKSKQRIFVYRYDASLNTWISQPTEWSGNTLSARISKSGLYALFYSTDDKEPILEVTVNGRPLMNGMLVPLKPTMGVLLQDVNGVDLSRTVEIKIDEEFYFRNGAPVGNSITVPDSNYSLKNVQISLTPELKPGKHKLSLKAADVNGNLAQKEVQFSVAEGFDIVVYGNYPNPFRDQTIISYHIKSNEEIDDFSIKIYTTSGRLIRSNMLELDPTIPDDNLLEPNYHEVIWDGTDDDGNSVANGVYFAVIKGKYKGKTVKRILKIARLR
ncbi:MAG: T9SS type A sorting domain-containing protein [Calditrichaeota bacterium]|nr:T9SS type A sorting domain-containing protein [Calditrichota bacterium]